MSQLWVIKASHPLTAERGCVQLSRVLEDKFLLSAYAGKSQALSKPRSLEEPDACLPIKGTESEVAGMISATSSMKTVRESKTVIPETETYTGPWDRKECKSWTPGNLRFKGGMRVVAVTFPTPNGILVFYIHRNGHFSEDCLSHLPEFQRNPWGDKLRSQNLEQLKINHRLQHTYLSFYY